MKCPCGSSLEYNECCELLHKGNKIPETALQLMKARYSAYVISNPKFLMNTTLPEQRKYYSLKDLEKWGKENRWVRLEIIDSQLPDIVEFKAYYLNSKQHPEIHHERSTFRKVGDRWYYVHGI